MDSLTIARTQDMLRHVLMPIRPFMDADGVQEVMVNGPDNVWVERHGRIDKVECSISNETILSAVKILAKLDNNKDAGIGGATNYIDTRLSGFRVAAALMPISVFGNSMSIRKHNPLHLSLEDYDRAGAFSKVEASQIRVANESVIESLQAPVKVIDMLRRIVNDHKNVLIVGGTSSGKTTFANAMIGEISHSERILTIEDTQELRVQVPNWVALEANEQEGVPIRTLVRLALRYRPDRIIVGEVRGGEAYDLMQAANTGHDGCMATLHANSAEQGLRRLENLVLSSGVGWPYDAIKESIGCTFHNVIFMARVQGVRRVAEIIDIKGYDRQKQDYVTEFIYRCDH